jgi:hypothetical protein
MALREISACLTRVHLSSQLALSISCGLHSTKYLLCDSTQSTKVHKCYRIVAPWPSTPVRVSSSTNTNPASFQIRYDQLDELSIRNVPTDRLGAPGSVAALTGAPASKWNECDEPPHEIVTVLIISGSTPLSVQPPDHSILGASYIA